MKPTRRGVLLGAAALATTRPALATPRARLTSLSSLKPGQPFSAGYPTARDPIVVLKLGRPATGGVGPDADIVAFSSLCTHHGCPVRLEGDRLLCPCHYSLFDPAVGGQCFQGPAPRELPRVLLEVDGDDVFAVGLTALPYGRAGWGEAELTSINCNSRLLRLYERFMDPPGMARPDWAICQGVARAAGFEGWDYTSAEDVFQAGAASFPDNEVDATEAERLPAECYKGVDYAMLRELGQQGIATPVRRVGKRVVGTRRRYLSRFGSEDGRFHWHASDPWDGYPDDLQDDDDHPFWLTTGRNVHLWQTGYHDRLLPTKEQQVPLPYVEIHPVDAERLGIAALEMVELSNANGSVAAQARITDAVAPGQLFALQYHWRGTANALSTAYTDPKTTIPWYKGARVAVRRIGPVETSASPLDGTHFG